MSNLPPLRRRPGVTTRVRVREYADGAWREREDRLATEEPLEIRLAWPLSPASRVAVTMRTPGHDFELAAGLLHGEGLLPPDGVRSVAYCTDADLDPEEEFNVVTVELASPPPRPPAARSHGVTGSASACGVCGTQSIAEVRELAGVRREAGRGPVDPKVLTVLPERLRSAQSVFERTGGLHGAGLFTAAGEPLVVREDIGRHNAVDKVVGARLLAGAPPDAPVLCVSGRLGFEIVQKAAAAGIGTVAGIGAPSSLAVRLAEETGLTLVGFLSERRFVTYAGADRLTR